MDTASRARDEWIVLRCQSGDPEGFEDLVRTMERPLLYYATKLLCNEEQGIDVLQDVWIRVFRSIRRLKDPGSLRAWLYRVTRGIAVDRIRRDGSRDRAEEAYAEGFTEAADASFEEMESAAIHRALDHIDIRFREVLVLHFMEDLSVAEIASVVGCPEGTVKSRLHHAKKAMKSVLSGGSYGTR